MIEVMNPSSGTVFAMKISGKLLHQDYEQFVPRLEKLIEEHGSIRCFIEMTEFHGIELRGCGMRSNSTSVTPTKLRLCRRRRSPWEAWMTKLSRPIFSPRRNPVLRHRRKGQGVGVDQRGNLNTSGNRDPMSWNRRTGINNDVVKANRFASGSPQRV